MATLYPEAIDGYAQIRKARNRIDEIVAEDHNDLRSAVVAIEQTLGINPQGPFGTVKARMDDAYQNIQSHVLGNPPRHQDTVIESPARSGTYHSLSQGTVGSQIVELLADINSLNFTGTDTYADGSGISATTIRNAINEIVGDVGGTSGAGKIGATGFTPGSSGQYIFSGTDVDSQIQESGDFIEEAGRFRARAFDAFITSGMLVTSAGGYNINIAEGHVFSNGRLLYYSGGSLSPSSGSTRYVYATITAGSISVLTTTSAVTATSNQVDTKVLLAILTDAGSAWSITDIRRFGMFVNNKHGFTVGNSIDSKDGYSYDFNSMGSAVNYISVLNSGGVKHAPQKITIATDIEETSTTDINLDGLEIDGGGHFVTLNGNVPLFDINASNVHIHDLKVLNSASPATSTAFATVATSSNVSGLIVSNCVISASSSTYPTYFIRVSDLAGNYILSESMITNNLARVTESAVNSAKPVGSPLDSIIENTIISENEFMNMLTGGSVSTEACIRVGNRCVVNNNIIDINRLKSPYEGAFIRGIEVEEGGSCIVSNNMINGGTGTLALSGDALMNIGIIFETVGNIDLGTVVSNNIIKGVVYKGIDCSTGGDAIGILIVNNYIDNRSDFNATVGSNFIGIMGPTTLNNDEQIYAIGNFVGFPGVTGIANIPYVANNIIFGNSSHSGLVTAIDLADGPRAQVAIGNLIFECAGIGIDCDSAQDSTISNNMLYGDSGISTTGINNMGSNCSIVNNLIRDYSDGILTTSTSNNLLINGNKTYNITDFGIGLNSSESCVITNNHLSGNGGLVAIYDFSSYSIVENNFITNFGSTSLWSIFSLIASNVIISNNIIENSDITSLGAIHVPYGTSSVVVGNLIYATPGYGILFSATTESICANNVLNGGGSTTLDGIYGMGSRSVVSGNVINEYCSNNTNTAIKCYVGADDVAIVNNVVCQCNGIGIDMNGGASGGVRLLIVGNFLNGESAGSGDGIIGINELSMVSNNSIINYGGLSGSTGIKTDTSSGKTSIIGNIIWPLSGMDIGIDLTYDVYYLVANNVIGNEWQGVAKVGIDMNGSSRVLIIGNMVSGSNTNTVGDNCIKDVGSWSIVSNNHITDSNYDGITISGDASIINGNRINNSSHDGIYVRSGADSSIISNNFILWSPSGGRYGIYVYTAPYTCVYGNRITQSGSDGIYFDGSAYGLINDNCVTFTVGRGLYVYDSEKSNIVGNLIRDVGSNGIVTYISDYTQIASNQIIDATVYGIESANSDHIHIVGNYIYNSGATAIYCGLATRGSIVANLVLDTLLGIFVVSLSQYAVIGNMIVNHSLTAYDLRSTSNFLASGNSNFNPGATSGVHGMDLASTSNALIVGNLCWGGSGAGSKGFNLPVTVTNTMSGNLSRNGGGGNPRAWGVAHIEDVDNIYIV